MMKNVFSSDILEEKFGPTTISVLYSGEENRVSCTKDLSGKVLEISWVRFIQHLQFNYDSAHKKVLEGESMGKVFKAEGIAFYREILRSSLEMLPPRLQQLYGNSNASPVIEVLVSVGEQKIPYAKIIETYTSSLSFDELGVDLKNDSFKSELESINELFR
ncbi:MAG: hypothetical protein ACHQT9_04420 [Candidatus Saccharimonadales bacterium]